MNQKLFPIGLSAAAGIAILLLMIFCPQLVSRPAPEPGPDTESGEAGRTTSEAMLNETVQAAGSTTVRRLGPPDEWYAAGAKADTYARALAGEGHRVETATGAFLGQSPPAGPYIPDFKIGRAYLGWDTSLLPDAAEVLSATLVLALPAVGGQEEAFDIVVSRGEWSPPIGPKNWQAVPTNKTAVGQTVGIWHLPASRPREQATLHTGQDINLFALEPAQTVRVPLDPAVVDLEGITRLELRHADEGVPPTMAMVVSLERSQVTLEVKYRP